MAAPQQIRSPSIPGLTVVGARAGVGVTVAACLIADQHRRRTQEDRPRSTIGVLKAVSTGCRWERESLVCPDAEQLAHAADFSPDVGDLSIVAPLRLRAGGPPALSLETPKGQSRLDLAALDRSIDRIESGCEALVIDAGGGLLDPLGPHPDNPARTLTTLDLVAAFAIPAVVVCEAAPDALSPAAATCDLLRQAGVRLAGLVINRFDADHPDPLVHASRRWLGIQNRTSVLATLPPSPEWEVRAMDPALREAVDFTDFFALSRIGARPGA